MTAGHFCPEQSRLVFTPNNIGNEEGRLRTTAKAMNTITAFFSRATVQYIERKCLSNVTRFWIRHCEAAIVHGFLAYLPLVAYDDDHDYGQQTICDVRLPSSKSNRVFLRIV